MLKGRYVTYSSVFSGGVLLQWFRDNFTGTQKQQAEAKGQNIFAYLDTVGNEGPTGILTLPHFAGAATPYMDANARGAILGLTLEHGAGDIYKALQEGICYASALNMELLAQSGIKINSLRIVGGGARFWLGGMAGKSEMAVYVKLIDASTGQVITERDIRDDSNPTAGAYSMGATDRALPVSVGNLIADLVINASRK